MSNQSITDTSPRISVIELSQVQVEALSSELRVDILKNFRYLGPCGVSDVAAEMRRSAESLYHHVRILEKVGLLRSVGVRRVVKRDQILYDVTHNGSFAKATPWDEAYSNAVAKFVKAKLLTFLEEISEMQGPLSRTDYLLDVQQLRRHSAKLRPEKILELRRKLVELNTWVSENETDDGIRTSMIAGLTPTEDIAVLDRAFGKSR